MTARIPESVLRETVEVCKRHQAGLNIGCWEDFTLRAADPSHGMEAMAERLRVLEAWAESVPHQSNCCSFDEICDNCESQWPRLHFPKPVCCLNPRIRVMACNCIKSRICEATGKDSLQVQGEVKA